MLQFACSSLVAGCPAPHPGSHPLPVAVLHLSWVVQEGHPQDQHTWYLQEEWMRERERERERGGGGGGGNSYILCIHLWLYYTIITYRLNHEVEVSTRLTLPRACGPR